MTPLQIECLLHYYYNPEPHPKLEKPYPPSAYEHAKQDFIRKYLLEDSGELYPKARYKLTERGIKYVESLKRVPLPVKVERWVTNYPESSEYETTNLP